MFRTSKQGTPPTPKVTPICRPLGKPETQEEIHLPFHKQVVQSALFITTSDINNKTPYNNNFKMRKII